MKLFGKGPRLPVIMLALVPDINFQPEVLQFLDLPNLFGSIDKRQLIRLELILILRNKKVVVLSFEKIDGGVYFLVQMHVLDLDYEHETVYLDCLFSEDV